MFTSKTLTNAEINYSKIEKEVLTFIFAVKKRHQYIYGRTVTIQTDHKPLLGLLAGHKSIPSMAAALIQRWAIILSVYNYKLCYSSGNENSNADCMSRLYFNDESNEKYSVIENHVFLTELIHAPVTTKEVALYTNYDPILSIVFNCINYGWPDKIEEQVLIIHESYGLGRVIPLKLLAKVLTEIHNNHPRTAKMKNLACSYVWWPLMDEDRKLFKILHCLSNSSKYAFENTHPFLGKFTITLDENSLRLCWILFGKNVSHYFRLLF